jgi:hypothetical protein
MERQAQRSRYFQEIARTFFDLRGAPFVLSSREMMTVAGWEEMGIPLRVVLEGIHRGFESYRRKRAGGRKMPSLSYCQAEVLKAFAEFRERRIGRQHKEVLRKEKKGRAKLEVEKFLQSHSPKVSFLEDIYAEALRILSRAAIREEALDSLESRAEEMILRQAQESEKAEVKGRVEADFKSHRDSEAQEIYKTQLVKVLREKYKIPHLSLFYY